MSLDANKTLDEHKDNLLKKELEKFMEGSLGRQYKDRLNWM